VTFGLAVQGLQVNGIRLLGGVQLDAILLLADVFACNEDHSVRPCESQLYGLDFVGGDGLAIQCKNFHGLPIAFQLVPILGGVTTMDRAKPKEKGYKHENRRRKPHDPACFHGLTTQLSSGGGRVSYTSLVPMRSGDRPVTFLVAPRIRCWSR